MIKRALLSLCVVLLVPSLVQAAPVKRYKLRGAAKETTYNLKGVKTSDAWATPVSIAQTGSTITINFEQSDGKATSWTLKKSKDGWLRNLPAFEIAPPSNSDFYYCELSGSLALKLSGNKGSFASFWRMDCEDDNGTTTAVTALGIKLRK
jgi:hypothetical protein